MRSIRSLAVASAVVVITFGAISAADAQHGRGGWGGGHGGAGFGSGATFGASGRVGGGWSGGAIRSSGFSGGIRAANVSGTWGGRGGWNRGFRTSNVAGTWGGHGWNRGWSGGNWNRGFRTAAVSGTWGGGWNRGWRGGWRGHRWGGWGFGPAVATGLAFGALATSPYWDAGYYDYGYDCGPQFVSYGPWGGAYVSDACYY